MSLLKQTTEIVTAYLAKNRLPPQDVVDLIESVYRSLRAFAVDLPESPLLEHGVDDTSFRGCIPAVPVDQAVTQDTVYCLICGKASKAIKGHLTKTHRIDIPTYRKNYGLSKDFPMVAPSYSATRRQLAVAAKSGERLQAERGKKKEP